MPGHAPLLTDMDHASGWYAMLSPPAPGHAAGHVAVNIASRGRGAVMIGDPTHRPIQLAHPERRSKFDDDPARAVETRRRFLDSHCETGILALTAHFPSPSVGHVALHAERAGCEPSGATRVEFALPDSAAEFARQ